MENIQIEQNIARASRKDITVVTLPMVALRGKVVLPNVFTSFDVGRIKSLNAVNMAIGIDRQLIFLTSQKDAKCEDPNCNEIYDIGVVCSIKHITKMAGENIRANIDCLYAAKILAYEQTDKVFEVTVQKLSPDFGDKIETEATLRLAKLSLKKYSLANPKFNKDTLSAISLLDNADEFANSATYNCPFKEHDKQKVLETTNVKDKLTLFFNLINEELAIASYEKVIQDKVRVNIEKNQKEFYLREQLKAIHQELGDDENEKLVLEEKIKEKNMPKEVEEKLLKELFKMGRMNPASPDYTVLRSYIEWVLDLPFNEESEDRQSLKEASDILEADHYGLDKVKERIVEYLAVLKLTKKVGGNILCLVGPPGVGKTSIATSVAKALNRKFVRMSLGGVKDEAEIRGHRKTYIGAMPGRLIYAMKEAKSINPVILLDEIDKMSSDMRGDPASAMLEVLDPEQNKNFRDRYIELPYDLSKVLFITTANSLQTIPAPLLDRMEIIDLNGYTLQEKTQIAIRYLIPKEIENNGLTTKNIEFDEASIEKIVKSYTLEAGVRTLQRRISAVCRKVATKLADNPTMRKAKITVKNLPNYLGVEKYPEDLEKRPDEVGVTQGLAWTSVGGTTLTIEVALSKGKGNIQLTGKLGEVMQESAKIALSYVKVNAEKYNIDKSVFETTDVYIHVPEGATPKDGPSAGVTMVTSIVSAFTNKAVNSQVAMTGEVTLLGKVLAIGGLKEKALAAYRIGITKVIIPHANLKDVEEIPKNIAKEITFIPVKNVNEVIDIAIKG